MFFNSNVRCCICALSVYALCCLRLFALNLAPLLPSRFAAANSCAQFRALISYGALVARVSGRPALPSHTAPSVAALPLVRSPLRALNTALRCCRHALRPSIAPCAFRAPVWSFVPQSHTLTLKTRKNGIKSAICHSFLMLFSKWYVFFGKWYYFLCL